MVWGSSAHIPIAGVVQQLEYPVVSGTRPTQSVPVRLAVLSASGRPEVGATIHFAAQSRDAHKALTPLASFASQESSACFTNT